MSDAGPPVGPVQNLSTADVGLTADDVAALTAASDAIEIEGGRYPDFLQAQTNL